jgi:hypothetical protein
MKRLYFFSLFLISFGANAQNNPRLTHQNGYGIQIAGPTAFLSGYYNHFWNAHLNAEVGLGIVGAYGGFKYFTAKPTTTRTLSPYLGASLAYIPPVFTRGYQRWIYLPVGLQHMNANGFHVSLEMAILFTKISSEPVGLQNDVILYGAIRFGRNF